VNRLLLHELFIEWNKTAGLEKLGLSDYFLLLKLIEDKEAPVQTFDDLVFACETLWLKSLEQRPAFHQLFEKRRKGIQEIVEHLYKKEQAATAQISADEIKVLPPITPSEQTGEMDQPETEKDKKREEPTAEPISPDNEPEGIVFITLGEYTGEAETDTNTQTYSFSSQTELLPVSRKYYFGTEYFPVHERALQQSWRNLYNNQDGEQIAGISIAETIKKICRVGTFLDFVYQPVKINRLSLFIFIDQGGSMVAHEAFGMELANTAIKSKVHAHVKPYFFYNTPQQHDDDNDLYLVYNQDRTEAFTTTKLFKGLNKKNIVLLIYSDAGAINGNINTERLSAMEAFLKIISKYTGFVAWLNPVPEHRWEGTTANALRLKVPEVGMFEATSSGIAQTMNALKGKLTTTLKKQYAAAEKGNQ
jgi:uncharacterized protein with von Willebrand factor type A (vWA) domain